MKLLLATRRAVLLGAAALLTACAVTPPAADRPTIVFVHGNGDSAAQWTTTLWRFESNRWPRDRLRAVDLPYPQARDADDTPQPGRSSSDEQRTRLAAAVDEALRATGAKQVVLIGNSRGGNAIRSYVAGGGAAKVSHVILGGTPNHGVWSSPTLRPTNEFNGAGPFLTALNSQDGPGIEITPGPQWMTIRSDANDKFAQPDGVWIGAKGTPTNVDAAGPELKGASNVVIPGIDHRETSYGPAAFDAAYRFIVGHAPARTSFVAEPRVVLDGVVSGLGVDNDPAPGGVVNNLPLVGASAEVYAVNPASGERLGEAKLRKAIGADGRWGPFEADPSATYEFVVGAPGYGTTHVYRSPFPRSSSVVNLRAQRAPVPEKGVASVVSLVRPRGYFGVPRDRITLDGVSPPAGIPNGVAGAAEARLAARVAPMRPGPS